MNKPRSSGDDKSRQNPNFLSSIAGRVGTVAREFRDVPTAIATGVKANFQRGQGAQPGSNQLQTLVDNATRADWNARRQYKEALQSVTGKKGTRSDELKGGKYINNTPAKKVGVAKKIVKK